MKSKPANAKKNPIIAAHRRFLKAVERPIGKVTENDLVAADLAKKYDEATLRKAVTMSAAVAREAWLKVQEAARA